MSTDLYNANEYDDADIYEAMLERIDDKEAHAVEAFIGDINPSHYLQSLAVEAMNVGIALARLNTHEVMITFSGTSRVNIIAISRTTKHESIQGCFWLDLIKVSNISEAQFLLDKLKDLNYTLRHK